MAVFVDGSWVNILEYIDRKIRPPVNQISFSGYWNAATNQPQIQSGIGEYFEYKIINTAGTTTIDNESTWQVDDWIVFNGTVWIKVKPVISIK